MLYIRLSSEYLLLDLQMSLVALFKIQCTAGQFIHVQRDLGKRGRPTVSLLCSRLISAFFPWPADLRRLRFDGLIEGGSSVPRSFSFVITRARLSGGFGDVTAPPTLPSHG